MSEQVVTTLVSKMKFEADNRPLLAFEKNLDRIFSKVDSLTKLAQKKIALKVGLDTKSLNAQLKVARNTKIVLTNIDVSREAVTATMAKLSQRLAGAKLEIDKVSISMKSVSEQKRLMRNLLDATQIEVPVELRLRGAEKQLIAWKKKAAEQHKLYISTDISKHKLFQNVKASLEYVSAKTKGLQIDPMIQLKVDRVDLKREIDDVLREIERAAKIRIQLNGDLTGGAAGGGEGGVRGFGRHAVTGGVAGAAMQYGRGFIPGLSGAFAISQMNQINQEYKGAQTALEAVSGQQDFAANDAFLKNISKEQGRNYRDLAPQFTQILAASKESIGSQGTQDMFRGIMKYGTMMNLDQEAMKGSFRAIGQMFSKDKIQAEEAQGQFAERMPAGMQLLAKAHGTTVAQLREDMKDGKLDPKKLIPELGKIMENLAESTGGYRKALESTRVAQGRFNATFEESVILFADSGMDKALGNFFRVGADSMDRSTNLIKALGGAFEYLMVPISAAMSLIGDFSEHVLPKIAEQFGMNEKAVIGFGAGALLALTPWGRMIELIGLAITALQDFSTYLQGGESKFGQWMESLSPEKQQTMKDFGNEVLLLAQNIGKLFAFSAEGWSNIFSWLEEGGAGWFVIEGVTALAKALNDLAGAMAKIAGGDVTMDDIGKGFVGALDTLVPGTPFADMSGAGNQLLYKYSPTGQAEIADAERKARMEQYERSRGSGADVPTVPGSAALPPVQVTINGVKDAQDLESRLPEIIRKGIQQSWQETSKQTVPQKR